MGDAHGIAQEVSDSKDEDSGTSTKVRRRRIARFIPNLNWVSENWRWSKIKVVIRCAVAAWASAILFIIPRVQVFMGQVSALYLAKLTSTEQDLPSKASFLILIGDKFP